MPPSWPSPRASTCSTTSHPVSAFQETLPSSRYTERRVFGKATSSCAEQRTVLSDPGSDRHLAQPESQGRRPPHERIASKS